MNKDEEMNIESIVKTIVRIAVFIRAGKDIGFSDDEIKEMVKHTMDKRKENENGKDV